MLPGSTSRKMSRMGVDTTTRLSIGWDDLGAFVKGTVVAWIPSLASRTERLDSALVELDEPLTAEGLLIGTEDTRAVATGRYLSLATRYVGQDWSSKEGIVHVTLYTEDPRLADSPKFWVADHGVYRTMGNARKRIGTRLATFLRGSASGAD